MSKVSLVIITYNQQLQTEIILESISHQKGILFEDIEVIIVDDGSDPIFEVSNMYDFRLNVIRVPNGGRAAARNRGIENSSHNFIIFCDGDRILDNYFIKNYMSCVCDDKLIIGDVREVYIRNNITYNSIVKIIEKKRYRIPDYVYKTDIIYDETGMTDSEIPWVTTFSGNMGIDKKLIQSVGMFDENFKNWGFEHFELGYRLYKEGVHFKKCDARNFHIAHTRDLDRLKMDIEDSFGYFYQKYEDSFIHKLQQFLAGNISLQDIESNKEAKWLKKERTGIFVGVGKRGCGI